MKYRKKPVVVEAITVAYVILCAKSDWKGLPQWFRDAYESGMVIITPKKVHISTLEGNMVADEGDWIIQGVKGELYPCKPDIFAATYDVVEA